MPRIAISYRRADAQDITGRIFDRLAARYGRESVFRDIDNIRPGFDFREQISEALNRANMLLVIVSPRWVGRTGRRSRINDEADPVRIEVETAIKTGIPIIPVLVGGTEMPRTTQLPDSIHSFVYRHAVSIDSGLDFDIHVDRLCRTIERILDPSTAAPAPVPPDPEPADASEIKEEEDDLDAAAVAEPQTADPAASSTEAAQPDEVSSVKDNSETVAGLEPVEEPGEPAHTPLDAGQPGSESAEADGVATPEPTPEAVKPEIAALSTEQSVAGPPLIPAEAAAENDPASAITAPSRNARRAAPVRKRGLMILLISGIAAAVVACAMYVLISPSPTVSTAPSEPTVAATAAPPTNTPAAGTTVRPSAPPPQPAPAPVPADNPAAAAALNLPPQLLPDDVKRLVNFDQNRAAAIAQAEKGADSKSDLDDLMSVLAGKARPITVNNLLGNWRCRDLKLGGSLLSLTIYTYFRCTISTQGGALIFQKVSGSQRTRGTLYRVSETRYVYVGASSYNDDPPNAYGATSDMDEVAYLELVAPNRLRLEFPKPHFESDFDIMDVRK